MAGNTPILGNDENILLTCPSNIPVFTPFTITMSIMGVQKSDTFKLYINNQLVCSTSSLDENGEFSYTYAYIGLGSSLDIVWNGYKEGNLITQSNEKTINISQPSSISGSVYYAYLYLKSVLDSFGLYTDKCEGLMSLVNLVEEL